MVIGYHLILTGYAHWLPNDPRGSMSRKTRTDGIAHIAETHFGRKSSQPSRDELRSFYAKAQPSLTHPIVWFDSARRQSLAEAFGDVVSREGLTCYACAILSNHAHFLIRKHRLKAEEMSRLLKDAGREMLHRKGLVPEDHPVFSADCCHVYKSDTAAMWNCVRYIESNFEKHHLPQVRYEFVTPYDNWPDRG